MFSITSYNDFFIFFLSVLVSVLSYFFHYFIKKVNILQEKIENLPCHNTCSDIKIIKNDISWIKLNLIEK